MVWRADGRLRADDGTDVSPELALVDPELRAWARERLPNPLESAALVRIASQLETESLSLDASKVALPPPVRPGGHRTRWIGVSFAAAALAAVLLFADIRVEFGKTPASAETADEARLTAPATEAQPEPPTTTAPTSVAPKPRAAAPFPSRRTARSSRSSRSRDPATRSTARERFAWAPVPGATGYHIELFRGSKRVFAADTARPAIEIPRRWRLSGRVRRLEPGAYRWYVWPVTSGRRAVRAVVQATLTIPAR